jgi:hypothetical protein
MKTLTLLLMLGSAPALAETLPYKVGDHVVETQLMDTATGKVFPNPLPEMDRACFVVEEISPTNIGLLLEAGYLDMSLDIDPPPPPEFAPPTQAPVGTRSGHSSSEPIFETCLPQDPTGYNTVSTVCEMGRLYTVVPDCKGRPLPPDLP